MPIRRQVLQLTQWSHALAQHATSLLRREAAGTRSANLPLPLALLRRIQGGGKLLGLRAAMGQLCHPQVSKAHPHE